MTRPPPRWPLPGQVDELDVFAWNAHLACPPVRLRATLDDACVPARPDVIVLNEVPYLYDTLADWCARHGYSHHQEPKGDRAATVVSEAGSTAVLVTARRRDLTALERRVAVMRSTWMVFSKKRRHAPRRYEVVRLATAGGLWSLRGSHWPTAGNRAALAETMARSAAWFARRGRRVAAADIGDHNQSLRVLRVWARAFGGRVTGHGVDSVIVAGAHAHARRLAKYGSDHHAIRYTLTRKEKR